MLFSLRFIPSSGGTSAIGRASRKFHRSIGKSSVNRLNTNIINFAFHHQHQQQRTMTIPTVEHMKQRAIEVLDEKIERRIIPAGDVLPDVEVTTFAGDTKKISEFYQDKPLLLIFLRASW